MGASFSGFAASRGGELVESRATGLGDLPESCVASIMMNLDPLEICKLAKLNQAFRCASSADFIWESKLPLNYNSLVHKILDQDSQALDKKQIYAKLCQSNPVDDSGNKEAWLDKKSGKLCVSMAAKALKIIGIDDVRYWNHIPTQESRFHTIAYLQQIWWFEVNGELEFEFPAGSYSLFFRLKLGKSCTKFGRQICNVDQVHGWNKKPVRFQLSTSSNQQSSSECYLQETGKWGHYHAGDFTVQSPNVPTKIKFSMMQIDCTHTKGGLCVDSVFVYPSEFRERLKQA